MKGEHPCGYRIYIHADVLQLSYIIHMRWSNVYDSIHPDEVVHAILELTQQIQQRIRNINIIYIA